MIEAADPVTSGVPTAEQLAEEYAVRVLRFATLVCRNPADAEDLAQEAMLKAIRGLTTYAPGASGIEAWLWRIVVNAARDAGRLANRTQALWERLAGAQPTAPVAEDTESLVLRRLDDAELVTEVRRLERRQQTLIALRYGAGLSYEEMAELLGRRPAALRQAVHRALAKLRTNIEARAPRTEEWA